MNLYYSTMLIHEDPLHPDYVIKKSLCEWMVEQITVKLTRIWGRLWAYVRGQMPSGAWNTSHGDSWIQALYFFLFCIWNIITAPQSDAAEIEEYVYNLILSVFYGDDFAYSNGGGKYASLFSVHRFASFSLKYLGLEIRDLYSAIPFCSTVVDGKICVRGVCLLKYFFIVNENKAPGQPKFLPFRETWDFVIRAVYSREPKQRSPVDVMLSCIGHAYGTFASNRDAYDYLSYLFYALALSDGRGLDVLLHEIKLRMTDKTIKKFRTWGVTAEEVLKGFPTWEMLERKNIVDVAYHDRILREDIELEVEVDYSFM